MISRKSSSLLALVYNTIFSYRSRSGGVTTHVLKKECLYDFLYDENYEAWFLNEINGFRKYGRPRELREFIMRLHTGESLASGLLPRWTLEEREELGQRYLKNLSEDIMKAFEEPIEPGPVARSAVRQLKSQLELDGYVYSEGILYPTESSVINEIEEQSYLEKLVDDVSLADPKTIRHHIELAVQHYLDGNWDDSIGNSRKFMESIFSQVADGTSMRKSGKNLNEAELKKPFRVREFLEQEGLIEKKEKEAISKVYGLLSTTGGHPYIAEKDQARLMRHLALTFSQFVLLRYQGFMESTGS